MEFLSLAISVPPELPRSKMRSTAMAVSGRAKSRATRRRTYSARDTPSSLARWRARRCTSFSSVIWVRDIMMATSYQWIVPRLHFVSTGRKNRTQGDEKPLLFSNYSLWKRHPPLCHLDRSEPGFTTSRCWQRPRVRLSAERAACRPSTPRVFTGNPGERSGEICGSAVPS
jgi:hypothetical protein